MGRPVGSIAELTLKWSVDNQTCLTVLHFRVFAASSSPDVQTEQVDIANSWKASFEATWLDAVGQDATLTEIDVQFIADTRWARSDVAVGDVGTWADNVKTPNIAAAIVKRTELAGRRYIGTLHMPCVPSNGVLLGVLTPTYKAALDNVAATLVTDFPGLAFGGTYQNVIYHRGGFVPNYTLITSAEVQPECRVMRRRTVGLGI